MTTTQDQVAALLAQADALKSVGALEEKYLAAKERVREKSTPRNRETYRQLAQEFADARSEARRQAVVIPTDGASATVVPGTIRG